jgi:RHS repeat-associated protein
VLNDLVNVTSIINTSGTVQERYGYNAFGTSRVMNASFVVQSSSSYNWETRFAAYRWDSESGLYQVRYRYYQPLLGTWINRDPIGERGGINLYGYVANGPVIFIDPLGLETAVVIGGRAGMNLFGHIAVATTSSGIYSSGTKEPFGSSFTDYIRNQASYRDSTIYVINTTPEEEAKIIEAFKERNKAGHNARLNNCSHQVSYALKQAGIVDRVTPFPGTLHSPMQEGIKGGNVTPYEVSKGSTSIPMRFYVFNP